MEQILKKKWDFYLMTQMRAPPVARVTILWGIDRSAHFTFPTNRVCQNMTFSSLCNDLNVQIFFNIAKICLFWLDLLLDLDFVKDS